MNPVAQSPDIDDMDSIANYLDDTNHQPTYNLESHTPEKKLPHKDPHYTNVDCIRMVNRSGAINDDPQGMSFPQ